MFYIFFMKNRKSVIETDLQTNLLFPEISSATKSESVKVIVVNQN